MATNEIYKEELRDLLSKNSSKRLEIREKPNCGAYVRDLTTVLIKSVKEIEKVMITGNKHRSIGSTDMNELSSRSHTIFTITVERCMIDPNGQGHIRIGKLNLVDLAGSERLRKNSLGENAKTVVVANIGPSFYNYDETINTLRYASRAKNIKNISKINDDPKDSLIKQYREEIERLKQLLNSRNELQIHLRYGDNGETQELSINNNNNNLIAPEEAFQIEKQRILNDRNIIAEENTRLLEELRNDALEQQKKCLSTQQEHENKMRQHVLAEAGNVVALYEDFFALQKEVDMYTYKLKKVFVRIQNIKQEIIDTQDMRIAERQKQMQVQEELIKKIKMNQLILENFVPSEVQKKIEDCAWFDEKNETWTLKSLS
ncbi:hypothetical protein ACTXT7_002256 [Hymenolepis weldensis]